MKKVLIALLLLVFGSMALSAREMRDSLSVDGPYVLYRDGRVRVISVDAEGSIKDEMFDEAPATLAVSDHEGRYPFEVRLRPFARLDWKVAQQPSRVFVMSDPHGRLDCVVSLLQGNGVIDSDLRWAFGDGYLVVIGDICDRGEDVVQIYWLFYKIQQEAEDAGGRVTMLLGNHEPMEFAGNMRYAKPKYGILARELGMEYRDLIGPSSELGRWIATWNTIGQVGRDVFVHAGLGGDFYRWNLPISEVNAQMSKSLFLRSRERKAQSDTLRFLYGSNGPIWYRGLVLKIKRFNPIQRDTLDLIRDRLGVDHIIVGHTIFRDVRTFHDGRVIGVNVDNPVNRRRHRGRALLIEDGRYFVVGDTGKQRELKQK
ncbi:MAG: metallophosphoesterase [Bacteroidales bacterium]|nr:metallophosphoesterase [Bacteroidales bacterium]